MIKRYDCSVKRGSIVDMAPDIDRRARGIGKDDLQQRTGCILDEHMYSGSFLCSVVFCRQSNNSSSKLFQVQLCRTFVLRKYFVFLSHIMVLHYIDKKYKIYERFIHIYIYIYIYIIRTFI